MLPYDLPFVQFASYSPQTVPGITSQAFLKRHDPSNLPALHMMQMKYFAVFRHSENSLSSPCEGASVSVLPIWIRTVKPLGYIAC